MYDKGRRNILLLFANLSCLFVNSSLVYLSFFLVNSYARHSLTRQLVNLSTRLLVNLIQYSLNYAKKYIKFCWL